MARAERKDLDELKTRERILEAARELFAEQGYSAASISKIAKRANVLPGSLYWAFPSKERLFIEVLTTTAEDWKQRVAPADPGDTLGVSNLRRQMSAIAADFLDGPEFLRLLMIVATEHQAGSPEIREAAVGIRRYWRERVERALADGLAGYEPEAARHLALRIGRLMLQLLDGAFMSLQLERDTSPEALFADIGDVLARELEHGLGGLKPRG